MGKTAVVTRPREQATHLRAALAAAGADVTLLPAIAIEPVEAHELRDTIARAGAPDGPAIVAFTSRNAVLECLRQIGGVAAASLARVTVAAVGPATAATLMEHGVDADLVPTTHTADGLADAIAERGIALPGTRVVVPCAADALDTLPRRLQELGAVVECITVYRAVTAPAIDPPFAQAPDVVTFASPTAIIHFDAVLPADTIASWKAASIAACIGPTTAQAARDQGYARVLTARVHTSAGLVAEIIGHFADTDTIEGESQ